MGSEQLLVVKIWSVRLTTGAMRSFELTPLAAYDEATKPAEVK